jgi:raffinose/stachyose/melibiose transport system substrate-binding protein
MGGRIIKVLCSITLVLSLFLLSACGSSQNGNMKETQQSAQEQSKQEDTSKVTTTEQKGGKTLSFATFQQWNNLGMIAAIAEYEKISGNKVDFQLYPDDQFDNLIKTKLTTGDVPDVFAYFPIVKNLPADRLEVLDGPWVEKLRSKMFSVRASDGAIVCAQFGGCKTIAAIYNKKVMEKAGVSLPIATYTELLDACEKIKDIGVTPIYLPNKEVWTAQILMYFGFSNVFAANPGLGDQITKNQVKPQDVPGFVEAMENVYALKEKGFINDNYMSATYPMALEAVAKGEAGMFAALNNFYTDIERDYPDKLEDVGMMPITTTDDRIYCNVAAKGQSGLFVPVDGEQKELAKEFVNIFVSEDVLRKYHEKQPGLSPYNDVEFNMSSWDKEMLEYGKTMPMEDQWSNQYTPQLLEGDYMQICQAFMAGMPAKEALEQWYDSYSILMKGADREGWK